MDGSIEYTVGVSKTFVNLSAGYRTEEEVRRVELLVGGEEGGVERPADGALPGEHTGMCLLGIAAGVPRSEVLRVRCGGGVVGRLGIGGACSTMVAMNNAEKGSDEERWQSMAVSSEEVFRMLGPTQLEEINGGR